MALSIHLEQAKDEKVSADLQFQIDCSGREQPADLCERLIRIWMDNTDAGAIFGEEITQKYRGDDLQWRRSRMWGVTLTSLAHKRPNIPGREQLRVWIGGGPRRVHPNNVSRQGGTDNLLFGMLGSYGELCPLFDRVVSTIQTYFPKGDFKPFYIQEIGVHIASRFLCPYWD